MKKIDKILIIPSIFSKVDTYGVQLVIKNMAKEFKKKGIKTIILTKRYPLNLPAEETIDGMRVFRFKRPKNIKDYKEFRNWLNKYHKELKPDIIHLMGIRRPMPLIGLILSRIWKVPYLVTFSGGDLPNVEDPASLKIWREGREIVADSVLQADYLTAFSKNTKKLAERTIPNLKNIKVIYAGVDRDTIKKAKKYNKGYQYFLCARSLNFSKGIDLLIKAFSKLSDEFLDIRLIIAGNGPEKKNLQKLVKKLELGDRVIFLGRVEPLELMGLMKGAIAHVCPSRTESGGLVNYEAQAAGTLAIGSSAGGIPEYIIHKKTGLIFESGNIESLLETLKLATDPRLRPKIIKNAQSSDRFNWRLFSCKYLKIYQSLALQIDQKKSRKIFVPWSSFSSKVEEIMIDQI